MDFYVPIGVAYSKHNEWADIDAEIHKRHKVNHMTRVAHDERDENDNFFKASGILVDVGDKPLTDRIGDENIKCLLKKEEEVKKDSLDDKVNKHINSVMLTPYKKKGRF